MIVDRFTYLHSILTEDCSSIVEVSMRMIGIRCTGALMASVGYFREVEKSCKPCLIAVCFVVRFQDVQFACRRRPPLGSVFSLMFE